MTLELHITGVFKKDLKKILRQRKDLEELYNIIELLVHEKILPEKYRDHQLIGNWKGRRECHIRPDWLLIYKIDKYALFLERTGSHSELFSK